MLTAHRYHVCNHGKIGQDLDAAKSARQRQADEQTTAAGRVDELRPYSQLCLLCHVSSETRALTRAGGLLIQSSWYAQRVADEIRHRLGPDARVIFQEVSRQQAEGSLKAIAVLLRNGGGPCVMAVQTISISIAAELMCSCADTTLQQQHIPGSAYVLICTGLADSWGEHFAADILV